MDGMTTPRSLPPLCGVCHEPLRPLTINGAVIGREACPSHPTAEAVFLLPHISESPAVALPTSDETLRQLALAATPGPWEVSITALASGDEYDVFRTEDAIAFVCSTGKVVIEQGKHDAAYIAACSPDAILSLLSRATTAEAEREAAVAALAIEKARLDSGACAKCGESERIGARHYLSGDASYGSLGWDSFAAAARDRLEFNCQRCGYKWWKPSLDASRSTTPATHGEA